MLVEIIVASESWEAAESECESQRGVWRNVLDKLGGVL
jgi:hypothetical protein